MYIHDIRLAQNYKRTMTISRLYIIGKYLRRLCHKFPFYLIFRLGAIFVRILFHHRYPIKYKWHFLVDSGIIHRHTVEKRRGKLTSRLSRRSLVRHISRGSSGRVCPRIRCGSTYIYHIYIYICTTIYTTYIYHSRFINVNFIRLLSIQVFRQGFLVYRDQMVAARREMYRIISCVPCSNHNLN